MDAFIRGNRQLNWKVVQRGFWVHSVNDLRAYLASAELFTMQGRANLIRCPTLITMAENDALAADADAFFNALECPKTLMRFSAPKARADIARWATARSSMDASLIGSTSNSRRFAEQRHAHDRSRLLADAGLWGDAYAVMRLRPRDWAPSYQRDISSMATQVTSEQPNSA